MKSDSVDKAPRPTRIDLPRLLTIVARELEDEIVPALSNDRVRTSAQMLSGLLRYAIADLGDPVGDEGPLPALDIVVGPDGSLSPRLLEAVREELDAMTRRSAAETALPLLRRDDAAREALTLTPASVEAYLRHHPFSEHPIAIENIEQLFGGFSKETFLLSGKWADQPAKFILRRDKKDGAVETSVVDEFNVVSRLHALGMAVPPPLLVERDPTHFGQPVALTGWLPGKTASNTQGMVMTGEHVAGARELAAFLGQLHAVDPREAGLDLGAQGSARDHIMADIERSEQSWRQRSHPASPILLAAYAWLKANIPDLSAFSARIVHGDAGLHNIMIHDGRISAMVDWELTHLGDPAEDLAYCRTWVDQVLPWDQFLAIYYQHGGPEYQPDREGFYGVLADVRIAAFSANCVDIINHDEHPELAWAVGGTQYRRVFKTLVANRLLGLHDHAAKLADPQGIA
ncbi:Predicted kinase, aminoglycoside phosphotransferase (APT) family [Sphingobium faniae]|nr:Predicted kinase, aminoglycoside phosphotransferase (APT) family [Sphingobium faniae]